MASVYPPLKPGYAYIYALSDPETGEVRYIGKSTNPTLRLRNHVVPSKLTSKSHRASWIKHLRARGLEPVLSILGETPVESWEEAERTAIAQYRAAGHRLTNLAPGGQGYPGRKQTAEEKERQIARQRGHQVSPETVRKISAALTGKKLAPERVMRMSLRMRGKTAWNKGRPWPAATREKLARDWIVTDPNGFVYGVRNLKEFCRIHGLHDALMHHVATGKRKHHKGWTCRRAQTEGTA